MKTRTHRRTLTTITMALLLLTAACGSDENPSSQDAKGSVPAPNASETCAPGTISGAGATFPQTIIQQWIKDFGAACPSATVNYQAVGSGAGIAQFVAGTVDFGASDAVMKPEEQQPAEAKGGSALHIPWTSGGIAVMYNLQGVSQLKLSGETLAGIYAGKIVKWNDAKLATDNPGVKLPANGIQVIHRSDGSGTTKVFTSYMKAVAPSIWTAGADKDVAWPTGQGAKGSDGVTAAVKQTQGSIGYAELSFAQANALGVALIKNAAGSYVSPSPEAVAAALAEAKVPADLKVEVTYTPTNPAAYPISTTTWALAFAKPADPAKAKLLKAFFLYALGPGQQAASGLSYAPLPEALLEQARTAVKAMAN
jgi:phosphate transport system substrate-binding protein